MKKIVTLRSSFPSVDTSWKDKTPIISTETVRMVTNLSKTFLQIQSVFIISNQKQMIFVLRRPWSSEKKSVILKSPSKTFTQNGKAISDYMYLLEPYVIFFYSSLWYQLIGTKRNPWVAKTLQSPIIQSSDTSTLLFTLELCHKSIGTFQRVIKNFSSNSIIFHSSHSKEMILVFRKTGSTDKKLLNFKRPSKTFTQDAKPKSNYIYPL